MLVTIIIWAFLFYQIISEFENVKKKTNIKKVVEKIDIIEKQKVMKNALVVKLRPCNNYMLPKKMPNKSPINDVKENEKIEKEVIRIASYRNKWNIEEFYNLQKRHFFEVIV